MHGPCGKEVTVKKTGGRTRNSQGGIVEILGSFSFPLEKLNKLGHGDSHGEVKEHSQICQRCEEDLRKCAINPSMDTEDAAAATGGLSSPNNNVPLGGLFDIRVEEGAIPRPTMQPPPSYAPMINNNNSQAGSMHPAPPLPAPPAAPTVHAPVTGTAYELTDVWVMPRCNRYEPNLCSLMTHVHQLSESNPYPWKIPSWPVGMIVL